MDFRQLGSTPVSKPEVAPAGAPAPQHAPKKKGLSDKLPKWLNVLYVVILFGIATLLVLVIISIARGGSGSNENALVDSSKYQAVFLNNGQVYFGKITDLNSEYVRMSSVYYLTQNSSTSSSTSSTGSDYTLVKLGCQQIHYPYDSMVISHSQVAFWENLNNDGKVVQSIKEFQKQNPNGPDCSQVTNQTQSSSNSSTQGNSTSTQSNSSSSNNSSSNN